MTAFLIVLAVAAEAYLLGSVDTGILVSKYLYHDDVRTHGSGAAGMTNMLRTFGKKAAALTAVGDVLKGVVAVCLGRWLFGHLPLTLPSRPIWRLPRRHPRRGGPLQAHLLRLQGRQGRAGGCRCHSGSPAGAAAGAGTHLPRLPGPHRHGVAGQHHHGRGYPVLTLVYSLMRGLRPGTWWSVPSALHHGRHGHLDAPFQHPRIRDGKEYRFGQKHKSN